MTIDDVANLLKRYSVAWADNDPDAIASHWHSEEPAPFYKAEEVPDYFHSLDNIKTYWKHNERFHETIRLGFSNVTLKPLAGDYVLAFVRMRWDIKFAADATTPDGAAFSQAGKLMGGENHVLALIKQTASGLKLAGWSETPDAPLSYMRQLYEWVADPTLR